MVIGDDEVEAEALRGFRFSKGAHAGVDGDDEANAFGVGGLKHGRLQAVSFAQAMRHMKANHAAEHFDGGLEQHHGGSAVDVVVAVEQDGLLAGDGRFDAFYGGCHAQHQQRIVEMGRLQD